MCVIRVRVIIQGFFNLTDCECGALPVLTGWLSGFIQQGATGQESCHGIFIVC